MGNKQKVIEYLTEMRDSEEGCYLTGSDELLVPVRMGDYLPTEPEDIVGQVQDYLSSHAVQSLRTIYSGVMHYGDNDIMDMYHRTPDMDKLNIDWMHRLNHQSKLAGLDFDPKIHSQPMVDPDMCTLVFSHHVLIAGGKGFMGLIDDLRHLVLVLQLRSAVGRPTALSRHMQDVMYEALDEKTRKSISQLIKHHNSTA